MHPVFAIELSRRLVVESHYHTGPGSRYPYGATPDAEGVNFSIFSRHATQVELLLFDHPDSPEPFQVILLDPEIHCTFFSWHVYVEHLPIGVCYNWRVDGKNYNQIESGFHFDRHKALLDPWAKAVLDNHWQRAKASQPGDNHQHAMRSIVVSDDYDWQNDYFDGRYLEQAIIYELHVGGFTRHPSSGVHHPGTFRGLMDKIPYLQELGITHVELLPIMAFDEQDVPPTTAALGLRNYWGYSTHSFFSPHPRYCVNPRQGQHREEFRDLVKALHQAGIGVILDVVFNHTAEGGAGGPVINFKGYGNEMFYHLDPKDRRQYLDYTGCGNTVNANHPLVSRFITNCLEYWVNEMHVDGFRFDLASALARGENGEPLYHAPVLWNIEFSDALARTRLIAEAWDAGGLYQVGDFPGYRWMEWNGRYRDLMRRFVRGDHGLISEVATRLSGSSDLYGATGRLPLNSINFISCHDGYTLNDLVSYEQKHNQANGENNRDGHNDNLSWNCGHEGETSEEPIRRLRRQQAKNFFSLLLLSHGVPMLNAGDEVLRTQRGNNNAYCQDNALSWFDWTLTERNQDMLRFVQMLIALRKRHPALKRRRFLTGRQIPGMRLPDVTWHGEQLDQPLWDDPKASLLVYTLGGLSEQEEDLHIMLNMAEREYHLPLPKIPGRRWHRAMDTHLSSPEDILAPLEQPAVPDQHYGLAPRTIAVLESRPAGC